MNKRHVIIIISLIVVLGLAFAAYYLVNNMNPDSESTEGTGTTSESFSLIKAESEQVVQIQIKSGNKEYTLIKGETWTVLGSDTIKLNQSAVQTLTNEVTGIYSSELVAENETYLTPYGLSEPVGTVIITLNNDEKYTLNIGNKTPVQTSYYVNTANEPSKVYILYSSKVDNLLAPIDKLRDKDLLSVPQEDIAYFNITRNEGDFISVKKKSEQEIEEASAANTSGFNLSNWNMTKPYVRDAGGTTLDDLVFKLSALKIQEYVDDNSSDLTVYGLNKPEYTIEYGNNEGKNIRLLIGKSEGNSSFAQLHPNSQVFKLNNSDIAFKDVKAVNLVDRLVHIVNIEIVDNVKISTFDSEYVLSVKKTGEEYEYSINGKTANESKFKKIYQSVIGLMIDDTASVSSGTSADIRIEYNYNNDKARDIIELISRSDRYYAISVNGKVEYSLEKKNAQLMLENLKEFNENPE